MPFWKFFFKPEFPCWWGENSISRMPLLDGRETHVAGRSNELSTGADDFLSTGQMCKSRRSTVRTRPPRQHRRANSPTHIVWRRLQRARRIASSRCADGGQRRRTLGTAPMSQPVQFCSAHGMVACAAALRRLLKRRSSPRLNHMPSQLRQRSMRASAGSAGSLKRTQTARGSAGIAAARGRLTRGSVRRLQARPDQRCRDGRPRRRSAETPPSGRTRCRRSAGIDRAPSSSRWLAPPSPPSWLTAQCGHT